MLRPAPFVIKPPADFLKQNPLIADQARRLTQAYENKTEIVTEHQLKHIGTALWNGLQLDDTLNQAKQHSGQQALPIIIESADPAIQALPWETLYHPGLSHDL